jgi:alkaline phosphatase
MLRRASLAILLCCACGSSGPPAHVEAPDAGPLPPVPPPEGKKPRVILFIGDGMGPGQVDAASFFAHGASGKLYLQGLPHRGQLDTGNLSGITDSAASATTMATGVRTWNGVIGLDRDGKPVKTLVEEAHELGLSAGLVTTASLPHATPAGFSAHRSARGQYSEIAQDQARLVKPEVLLGGGTMFFQPDLAPGLQAEGWELVSTPDELMAATPDVDNRLLGLFAAEHMTYVIDRTADKPEPTLAEMALKAVEFLDQDPDGFFLMVEGARIDMASHANQLARAVPETLAFDDAIRAVDGWAATRDDVLILVTADHETGGLGLTGPSAKGVLPTVTWRWGQHTNTRVGVYGRGPGSQVFDGQIRDHTWIHAACSAALREAEVVPPEPFLVPDGDLRELRHRAAQQTNESGFGVGYNQLDALWLDADATGLAIGVEGLFQWGKNAVVFLVDVDYGAGTGPARLEDALSDVSGKADSILAASQLDGSALAGFGVDFAVVVWGGQDPRVEDLWGDAGLRGLSVPDDLPWLGVATNFADGTRVAGGAALPRPGNGLELYLPWAKLYKELAGKVPPGATVAISAVLVNDDGGYVSNQALPSFPPDSENPGRVLTPLPGLATFVVDADANGVGDGTSTPVLVTP